MAQSPFKHRVIEFKNSVLNVSPKKIEDEMNRLGAQGWELISTHYGGAQVVMFLKQAH